MEEMREVPCIISDVSLVKAFEKMVKPDDTGVNFENKVMQVVRIVTARTNHAVVEVEKLRAGFVELHELCKGSAASLYTFFMDLLPEEQRGQYSQAMWNVMVMKCPQQTTVIPVDHFINCFRDSMDTTDTADTILPIINKHIALAKDPAAAAAAVAAATSKKPQGPPPEVRHPATPHWPASLMARASSHRRTGAQVREPLPVASLRLPDDTRERNGEGICMCLFICLPRLLTRGEIILQASKEAVAMVKKYEKEVSRFYRAIGGGRVSQIHSCFCNVAQRNDKPPIPPQAMSALLELRKDQVTASPVVVTEEQLTKAVQKLVKADDSEDNFKEKVIDALIEFTERAEHAEKEIETLGPALTRLHEVSGGACKVLYEFFADLLPEDQRDQFTVEAFNSVVMRVHPATEKIDLPQFLLNFQDSMDVSDNASKILPVLERHIDRFAAGGETGGEGADKGAEGGGEREDGKKGPSEEGAEVAVPEEEQVEKKEGDDKDD